MINYVTDIPNINTQRVPGFSGGAIYYFFFYEKIRRGK